AARNEGRHLVIDIGAGFQDATYSIRLPCHFPTIALIADSEVAYGRWRTRPGNTKTREEYERIEFTDARRALYDRSRMKIDSTLLSVDQVADHLVISLARVIS